MRSIYFIILRQPRWSAKRGMFQGTLVHQRALRRGRHDRLEFIYASVALYFIQQGTGARSASSFWGGLGADYNKEGLIKTVCTDNDVLLLNRRE